MLAWSIPRQAFIVPQHVHRVRTLAAIGRGDFETAYTEATKISPRGLEPGTARQLQLFVAYDLVEAAVRTGRSDQARDYVEAMLRMDITKISTRWAMLVAAAQGLVSEERRRTPTSNGPLQRRPRTCGPSNADASCWPTANTCAGNGPPSNHASASAPR